MSPPPRRLLILVAGTTPPEQALGLDGSRLPLSDAAAAAAGGPVDLVLATWAPIGETAIGLVGEASIVAIGALPETGFDRLLRGVGAFAIARRLARYPLGRLINSWSATDPSRTFERRLRSRAGELLTPADAVIAADLPATRSAWHLLRRGLTPVAVFTLEAGLERLGRRSASS